MGGNRRRTSRWAAFLDSLDTGGGHIFVLLILIFTGIGVYHFLDSTAGGQIITLAFGALLALTKATKSNREQAEGDNGDGTPQPPGATPSTTVVIPPGATIDGGHVQLGTAAAPAPPATTTT